MTPQIITLFKINEEVIIEEKRVLYANQIDEMKWIIAEECSCSYDDIDVEFVEHERELAEQVDISVIGLIFFDALYLEPIQGVECQLEEGSDEYLDAILDGTIERYLNFYID